MLWLVLAGCGSAVCRSDVECGPASLCWSGACEPVLDRIWEVEVAAAEVGWTLPDGSAWDEDLSPPDLYVEVGPSGAPCATAIVQDTNAPVFYEGCSFYAPEHPRFRLALLDYDGPTSELVAEWVWDGERALTELALATAGFEIAQVDESGTSKVWMTLWPR
jgi:hypothetical protein